MTLNKTQKKAKSVTGLNDFDQKDVRRLANEFITIKNNYLLQTFKKWSFEKKLDYTEMKKECKHYRNNKYLNEEKFTITKKYLLKNRKSEKKGLGISKQENTIRYIENDQQFIWTKHILTSHVTWSDDFDHRLHCLKKMG